MWLELVSSLGTPTVTVGGALLVAELSAKRAERGRIRDQREEDRRRGEERKQEINAKQRQAVGEFLAEERRSYEILESNIQLIEQVSSEGDLLKQRYALLRNGVNQSFGRWQIMLLNLYEAEVVEKAERVGGCYLELGNFIKPMEGESVADWTRRTPAAHCWSEVTKSETSLRLAVAPPSA